MTGIVFRAIGFLLLIAIGASVVTFLITKDRRWLRFSWQILKYTLILALTALGFLVFERLIIAV